MKNMRTIITFSFIGILIVSAVGGSAYSIKKTNTLSTNTDENDMVIIAPDKFSANIQPLITHKNNYGIRTFMKTVEEIYSEYPGRDSAEQIKYFIKDTLETFNISYVLLVGDIDKVPIRTSWIRFTYGGVVQFEHCVTDHYYADIYDANGSFCSWDTNNNDKFGETVQDIGFYNNSFNYIDSVDLFPDVIIGRLPCSDIDEVTIVVNKIIRYETQTGNTEWLHRIIFLGGDTFPYSNGWSFPGCEMYEGEHVTGYIGEHMIGFDPVYLWASLKTFSPFSINHEINKGAGFVCYSGHGSASGFGTYRPNSSKLISYIAPRLCGLRNDDRLPIIYLSACSTAQLDASREDVPSPGLIKLFYYLMAGVPYQSDSNYPCFAWQLVRKNGGGAIAVIGATEKGLAGEAGDFISTGNDRFNVQFFLSYEPGITVGEMFFRAKQDYMINAFPILSECINIEELTLIGDPSLKIGRYTS